MSHQIGFDNEKYLEEQSAAILERVKQNDNKLYLEFGGKLLFDYHASRVLPGYEPNVKMRLVQEMPGPAIRAIGGFFAEQRSNSKMEPS